MTQKKFKLILSIMIIVGILLAVVVGWNDYSPTILLSIAVISMVLFWIMESKLTNVIEDERTIKIEGKAAKSTLMLFVLGASGTSIYLSGTRAGMILIRSISSIVLLFITFKFYYQRKI